MWTQRCKEHGWTCNQPSAVPAVPAAVAMADDDDNDDDDDEEEYKPTGQEQKMLAGMGRTTMRNEALLGVVWANGL